MDEHIVKYDFVPLECLREMLFNQLITTKTVSLAVSQTKLGCSFPPLHPATAFRKVLTIAVTGLYIFG